MAQRRNMKAIQICLDIADKYRAKQPQPPQTETNIAVITPGAKLINAALRGELPPATAGPMIEAPKPAAGT